MRDRKPSKFEAYYGEERLLRISSDFVDGELYASVEGTVLTESDPPLVLDYVEINTEPVVVYQDESDEEGVILPPGRVIDVFISGGVKGTDVLEASDKRGKEYLVLLEMETDREPQPQKLKHYIKWVLLNPEAE